MNAHNRFTQLDGYNGDVILPGGKGWKACVGGIGGGASGISCGNGGPATGSANSSPIPAIFI